MGVNIFSTSLQVQTELRPKYCTFLTDHVSSHRSLSPNRKRQESIPKKSSNYKHNFVNGRWINFSFLENDFNFWREIEWYEMQSFTVLSLTLTSFHNLISAKLKTGYPERKIVSVQAYS